MKKKNAYIIILYTKKKTVNRSRCLPAIAIRSLTYCVYRRDTNLRKIFYYGPSNPSGRRGGNGGRVTNTHCHNGFRDIIFQIFLFIYFIINDLAVWHRHEITQLSIDRDTVIFTDSNNAQLSYMHILLSCRRLRGSCIKIILWVIIILNILLHFITAVEKFVGHAHRGVFRSNINTKYRSKIKRTRIVYYYYVS